MQPEADEGPWAILVARTHQPLASRATMARTFCARVVGLLGRSTFPQDEAVIFPRCTAIHTFGMRFPIDAIFVDRTWRVVALRGGVSPWQIVPPVWKAWGVVEMTAGNLRRVHLEVGDQLQLLPVGTQCGQPQAGVPEGRRSTRKRTLTNEL